MSGKDDRRSLRDADQALWDVFSKQIKPLKKPQAPPAQVAPPPKARKAPPPRNSPTLSPALPAPKAPPPLAPLGRREKAKVARGHTDIEARLDLHGRTQTEAHGALLRFLRRCSERQQRVVLVITGKSGVLRRQVPQWLALPEFRALLVGYEQAAIKHGGEGALYLRLRRASGADGVKPA
jgi:DNA-nicking Smr family endonuclease